MNSKDQQALACSALISFTSFANTLELPSNCQYGRVKSYDVHAGQDLANAIEAGYDIYQDPNFSPAQYPAWFALVQGIRQIFEGFDYLRIETPKHVLQGVEFRTKANLFDRYANVRFSNSESGYVGTDKSNLDANAYLNMKFNKSYGVGLVWVHRAGGMCSAESVWVQKPPKVAGAALSASGGQVHVNLSYLIDKYSRAYKDPQTPLRVSVTTTNQVWMTSDFASKAVNNPSLSGQQTLSVRPRTGGGRYTVYATVDDGTYSHGEVVGSILVPGVPISPCQGCQIP
jgi:hypothetical protein